MPLTFDPPSVFETRTANYFRILSILVDVEQATLQVNVLRGTRDPDGTVHENKRFYFETPLKPGHLKELTLETLEVRIFGLAEDLGYVPAGGKVS